STVEIEWLEDEPKTDGVFCGIAWIGEGLTGKSVVEGVHQAVANGPGVSDDEAPGMGPILYRGRVWKPWGHASLVVDHVRAKQKGMLVIQPIIETRSMRVERHRRLGIEAKTRGVQLPRQGTITHREVISGVLGRSLCQGCERQRIDSYSVATGRKNCLQLGGS